MTIKIKLKSVIISAVFFIAICYLTICLNIIYESLKNSKFAIEKNEDKITIAILSPITRKGEANQAEMVFDTLQKMGYPCYLYYFNDAELKIFKLSQYITSALLYFLKLYYHTDLHLAISHHIVFKVPEIKIMYMSLPPSYITLDPNFTNAYPHILDFKHFIDINLYNSNFDWLSKALNKKIIRHKAIIGHPKTEFKFSYPNKLLFYGSLWGRNNSNIINAFTYLAEDNLLELVNHPLNYKYFNQKFFISAVDSYKDLQNLLHEYGLILCLHSKLHYNDATPTSRIFEIIASSSLPISDNNYFLIKYFGQNIFYFDPKDNVDEIYHKIKQYYQFALKNPKKIEQMTLNNHQIFSKNFTTEIFLQELIKFYNDIKNYD